MKKRTIPAAQFKAQCLSLLDEVERGLTELVVTKRGRPVARLVAMETTPRKKKLECRFIGDVIGPVESEWIE